MKKETVFILVDVNERFPEKAGTYFVCISGKEKQENGEWDEYTTGGFSYLNINFEGKKFTNLTENEVATHWLEEKKDVYVFDEPEIRKLLSDAFRKGETRGITPGQMRHSAMPEDYYINSILK